MSEDSVTTGTVDFQVGAKTFQTWYKIKGDLKSKHRPVVTLHGGAGLTHDYMLPHEELFIRAGIPVLFYDQIGNGHSSHYRDAPNEFWTLELFKNELDNLLQKLGIYDDFDLLGHSWGGILGGEYAATRAPKGLKRLILSNAPSSARLWDQGTENLVKQEFGAEVFDMLRKHEAAGTIDDPEYEKYSTQHVQRHICTVLPWPHSLKVSFAAMNDDPTVLKAMMGSFSFSTAGALKEWSMVGILHRIPNPTLVINAPGDSIQPLAILPQFIHIPKVKWVELQHSTHLAIYEEPDKYFEVVLEFLAQTEGMVV